MRTQTPAILDEAAYHGWYRVFVRGASAFVQVCAVLPFAWLACFYGLILRVRLLAGAWPPDCGARDRFSEVFPLHIAVAGFGLAALPLIFISWLPAAGFLVFTRRGITGRRIAALTAFWLLVPLIVCLDPFHFLWWCFLSSD